MISTGCVCLVKTKMKYRTVEKEEIQRETGREIWVGDGEKGRVWSRR